MQDGFDATGGRRRLLPIIGRVLGLVGLLVLAFAYHYVVWRVSDYAWAVGLRFYKSPVITVDALRDGVHLCLLTVLLFTIPRYAGVGVPEIKKSGWATWAYVALAGTATAAVVANHIRPFFSNPFLGRGPLFFTLGPLSWELTWAGFIYGFASALAGENAPPAVRNGLVIILALAGMAWYAPVIPALRPYDRAGFLAVALAVNFLSLTLRRRTGSIWPGLAGHVLVKFILTW
ncbi:MAG: hypothetical protein PVH29_11215 [Candidatus Zixiibacteriota bacterium]|jgi:hypothetical protein